MAFMGADMQFAGGIWRAAQRLCVQHWNINFKVVIIC